jgi:hypothetical protein
MVDNSIDGLFVFKLTEKVSKYTIVLIACYLPPERSPWGRDACSYFAYILNIIHVHTCSSDALYSCGDLNSRLGDKQDYVKGVDPLFDRQVLDKYSNKHGEAFHEFLIDSKMCLINGRIAPDKNDYTFVSTRGKSVVDYFAVPIANFNTCLDFSVSRPMQLITQFDGRNEVFGEQFNIDHSLLTLEICISTESGENRETVPDHSTVELQCDLNQDHVPQSYFTRYKCDNTPPNPFTSDLTHSKLNELIADIETFRVSQSNIDRIYSDVCNLYHEEMKLWFKARDIRHTARKKLNKISKPFWNDTLQALWNDLVIKEKDFAKVRGHLRQEKRASFKLAQKLFDKEYRKEERRYKRNKESEIESLCTSNPKEFWKLLKELGPKKADTKIPMEVYDNTGRVSKDLSFVFEKWRKEYENLYNPSLNNEECDMNFYENCIDEMSQASENDNNENRNNNLNLPISQGEIQRIVLRIKNRKSVGIDNIPHEILKNEGTVSLLTKLFNIIFEQGVMPSTWNTAIIKPIPKSSLLDFRLPLQYRGISLLSTVYKIYTAVLNERLLYFVERNSIYKDEQNGFRKHRSCAEHIYTLTSIIRNRKTAGKPTFVGYVDFEKAFDRVDRDLLLYKIMKYGIGGKMLNSLRMIYSNANAGIELNGTVTNWFNIGVGVRQGDPLSPTLFGLYVNDLVDCIKDNSVGIHYPEFDVQCLLFADDLVLISESESDLQKMFDCVSEWCMKWRMKVNVNKSKVVHYRVKSHRETNFIFNMSGDVVEKVPSYKYLGLILDYSLDFNVTAKVLGDSGGRAYANRRAPCVCRWGCGGRGGYRPGDSLGQRHLA